MSKKRSKSLLDEVKEEVDTVLKATPGRSFYRLERHGVYNWQLIRYCDGQETIMKKDIQEICWAYMKRAIIEENK